MAIVRKKMEPSREDAVRLRRKERDAMLDLILASTVMDGLAESLAERIDMIPDGMERVKKAAKDVDTLLTELRMTVPENQRVSLDNIGADFVMRTVPKATPGSTNVLMSKEEFRTLVNSAQSRCKECAEDDVSCGKCDLYQLLTCILPLDNYHSLYVCPYSMGEWKN